jgi:hypothetical protein
LGYVSLIENESGQQQALSQDGILKDPNPGFSVDNGDGDDIKSASLIFKIMFQQIPLCDFLKLFFFEWRNGFFRRSEGFGLTVFHFNEDEIRPILSDDIDLTPVIPEVAIDDTISFSFKESQSNIFPQPTFPLFVHDIGRSLCGSSGEAGM